MLSTLLHTSTEENVAKRSRVLYQWIKGRVRVRVRVRDRLRGRGRGRGRGRVKGMIRDRAKNGSPFDTLDYCLCTR